MARLPERLCRVQKRPLEGTRPFVATLPVPAQCCVYAAGYHSCAGAFCACFCTPPTPWILVYWCPQCVPVLLELLIDCCPYSPLAPPRFSPTWHEARGLCPPPWGHGRRCWRPSWGTLTIQRTGAPCGDMACAGPSIARVAAVEPRCPGAQIMVQGARWWVCCGWNFRRPTPHTVLQVHGD